MGFNSYPLPSVLFFLFSFCFVLLKSFREFTLPYLPGLVVNVTVIYQCNSLGYSAIKGFSDFVLNEQDN